MRKALMLWLLGALFAGASLFAQITPRNVEIVPDTFYVGDTATMRMVIDVSIDTDDAAIIFLNEVDWGEINNVAYKRESQRSVVEMSFVAYRPGTIVIPNFMINNHTIQGYSSFVSSILTASNEEVEDLKELMQYPRIGLYIFFLIAFSLCITALFPFVLRFCKWLSISRLRKHLETRYMIKRHYQSTLKRFLQNDQLQLFEEITQLLRVILAEVYHPSLQSATRAELERSYLHYAIDPSIHRRMQILLTRANDSVYGGRRYTSRELDTIRSDLSSVHKNTLSVFRNKWMHDSI